MPPRKTQETPAATKAKDAEAPEGPTFEITCLQKAGRRRAGRSWPAGTTVLPVDALSDADRAALEADPFFTLLEVAG
ncbi:hypothetical protein [Palleronia caenipelagi]|uniref:Mu-like prophage FluMu N-terminal domain-containing protein n=1 Tax=Palleronia caenipelagi TaxID=2489174 RepID=A0A547PW40_9RHOB|nr:hypothetical protein [Palleronia caenipelagi]TRD18342.1 hypothetical protein FEV53_11850 [Palleronia caenipelagi]